MQFLTNRWCDDRRLAVPGRCVRPPAGDQVIVGGAPGRGSKWLRFCANPREIPATACGSSPIGGGEERRRPSWPGHVAGYGPPDPADIDADGGRDQVSAYV